MKRPAIPTNLQFNLPLPDAPAAALLDFVAGHKIELLLPAALCGLGRPRAVECGVQA